MPTSDSSLSGPSGPTGFFFFLYFFWNLGEGEDSTCASSPQVASQARTLEVVERERMVEEKSKHGANSSLEASSRNTRPTSRPPQESSASGVEGQAACCWR